MYRELSKNVHLAPKTVPNWEPWLRREVIKNIYSPRMTIFNLMLVRSCMLYNIYPILFSGHLQPAQYRHLRGLCWGLEAFRQGRKRIHLVGGAETSSHHARREAQLWGGMKTKELLFRMEESIVVLRVDSLNQFYKPNRSSAKLK